MPAGDTSVGVYGLRLTGAPLGHAVPTGAPVNWPQVEVRTAPHPADRPEPMLNGDRAVIELRDEERTLVADRAAGTAVYYGPPLEPDVLAHPYLGPTASLFSRWLGREAFHAGAFRTPAGPALAVLGNQLAGKSTLMARLAARGVPIVADDMVIVDAGRVFLGPRTIDLRQAPTEALRGELAVSRARGDTRWRLALPPAEHHHDLGGWVFLRRGEAAGLTVERLAVAELLPRLARARGHHALPSDPSAVLDLAALPAWQVTRPLTWEWLDPTVEALLALLPA